MNKTMLKRLTLFALALLTVGGANAATETYDFKTLSQGLSDEYTKPTFGDNVAYDMQMISLGENTFNNRFSTGTRSQNGSDNCFRFRNRSTWEGLHVAYSERYFSIRNLKAGDKITITLNASNNNIKFRDTGEDATKATVKGVTLGTDAVTSNQKYEIESDGIVNLETTGACIIEKVVIEQPSVSVPVTINVLPEVYDFKTLSQGLSDEYTKPTFGDNVTNDMQMISLGENTFNNRFSTGTRSQNGSDNCFRFRKTSNWEGLHNSGAYSGRYFSIRNLKAGDKITITLNASNNNIKFRDTGEDATKATVKGVTLGTDAVTSNQEYEIESDGIVNLETTGACIIEKVTIKPVSGTRVGATLVSNTALDFTDVEGITAYVATEANAGSVTFSKVTKVAAETPLYIKANEKSGSVINVNVPEATEGAVDYSATNLLKGSASSSTDLKSNGYTNYYVYGVKDNVPGWYLVTDNAEKKYTSVAGKAYLEVAAAASPRSYMSMYFDDKGTTGIEAVEQPALQTIEGDGYWYNLQGQRVENPTKGIYIRNGKKVFFK